MKAKGFVAGAAAAAAGGLFFFNRSFARKAEAQVPPDGDFVDVDGNRIHYAESGSGSPILMIHGLAGQMRNFARPLVEDLARDHRVIRIDRPGSGYSTRASGATASLRDQAAAVASFIRKLGLEKPLIVGHSLGGALALAIALDHPDCVGDLALVCPLTQHQDEAEVPEAFKGLIIRSPFLRRLVANSIAVPMALAMQDKVLKQVFGPEPVPEDFATEGGGALGARPDAFYESSADLCALEHEMEPMVARYGELKLPVSILFAEDDQLLDPDLHGVKAADQIPGAKLKLVPGGHMLPFTQPEMTAGWLREVLAERQHA